MFILLVTLIVPDSLRGPLTVPIAHAGPTAALLMTKFLLVLRTQAEATMCMPPTVTILVLVP